MADYPRYIQDKPKGIDRFDGGSQEALSCAIAAYILENDSRAESEVLPRIIGIEGDWGSGKSNVVKMVERKLSDKRYYPFEYDAWGNQEDLQRRSLLEQLTSKLVEDKVLVGKTSMRIRGDVVKDKTWDELLKLLLSHKTEKTSRSIPELNGGIVSAILVGITIPITCIIADSLNVDNCIWVKLLIACLPPIIAFFVWLYCIIKSTIDWPNEKKLKKRDKRKARRKDNKYLSWAYFTTIYSEKEQTTHDYEVISENEPTVVDFKNWMDQISKSLDQDKRKKLLIIFDNMDRLPAEKVKQLWSSIHTFFAETGFNNIWVIIPYDESHLSCAFGDDGKKKELTRYFIEKTFPVTFSVSAPVITDYCGIFNKLFEEAFGNTQKTEQEIIGRLYRLSHKKPNIREIIIFINKLVATYATRGEDVRLQNMAIYILHKDDIEHDEKRSAAEVILSGDYLGYASNFIDNDSDLKSEIAALTYGVNKQMASQIPMTEYIENCLDKTEGYEINTYSKDENFVVILKEVVNSIDAAKLDKTIEVLDTLSITGSEIDVIWEELCKRQLKERVASLELSSTYRTLLKHIKGCLKERISRNLCSQWAKMEKFNGGEYITCVNQLAEYFDGIKNLPLQDKTIDADSYISAVLQALDNIDDYHLNCDLSLVDDFLSKDVAEKFTYYQVVESLKRTKGFKFEKLHQAIKDAIKARKLTSKNVGQLCLTNRLLCNGYEDFKFEYDLASAQAIVRELETNNKKTLEDGYIDMLAYDLSKNSAQKIEDDVVSNVAQIIGWYDTADNIISKATGTANVGIKNVAKFIIQHKCDCRCDIAKFLSLYNKAVSSLKVTGEEILAYLDGFDYDDELTQLTKNKDNFRKNIPDSNVFIETSKEETGFAKSLNKKTISMIVKNFTASSLKNLLTTNYSTEYWNNIIYALLDTEEIRQADKLLTELAELIIKDIPTNASKIEQNEYTKRLADTYSSRVPKQVFTDIRNRYCKQDVPISADAFELLELPFRTYNVYEGYIDDSINYIIKPVISDNSCKAIFLQNADYYQRLIAKSTDNDGFGKFLTVKWGEEDARKILTKSESEKER